jgi:DNA (cytosine-5)-methyltransferase 1
VKHLGDITLIQGNDAPVVDVVIGGSPCQDLSVAGKRAGLAGERSGLYMEQIRIIKEMREHDRLSGRTGVDVRPRYMVWENVPGAFSSNGGKDFAAVIEEAIRVAEPEAPSVPVPTKGWPTSGVLFDESGRWSVAWRILDAQFWGTSDKPLPQRRRRIALIADFGGISAPEILFVRQSVSGDIEPGEQKGKEAAGDAGESISRPSCCLQGSMIGRADKNGPQGDGINDDIAFTLNTTDRHAVVYGISSYHSNCMKSDNPHSGIYEAETSRTLDALNCGYPGCNQGGMAVVEPICINERQYALTCTEGKANTLTGTDYKGVQLGAIQTGPVTYQKVTDPLMANSHPGSYTGQDAFNDMLVAGVDCRNMNETQELYPTMQSKPNGGQSLNFSHAVRVKHIVRRLTPLECERLQGFPDGWTDIGDWVDSKGKKHKAADSPRYKALGNSIAIPPWKWVLKRLCACYERDATMASLFDGIGGFPYIWEQLNGKGSCLWASEIEEFPMAVTRLRFKEETNDK